MVDSVISALQSAAGNTTNLVSTPLLTDFNVLPYYDDYDPNKQFYRLLFKPGYAVQARELTQIQSMLQNQIYRFGKHVFKEGSIVLPGGFTLRVNRGSQKGNPIDYIKLRNVDVSNNVIDVSTFVGQTVVGATSNISAYVVDVAKPDGTTANSATLYVTYLSASSSNSSIRTFAAGETLTSANSGTCIVKNDDPIANTGYASWFQIEEGVYFAKEHFIHFPTQSVILDRYNPNPSCKVGFFVSEQIITAAQDSSLLDPALESSNYSAPGADRFKLLSTLSVRDLDDPIGSPDFVTLFTIKNGVIQVSNETSDYDILGDRLADRTSNESGDYVVNGLNVQLSEHDRVTSGGVDINYGRYANGNNQLMVVGVDPGLAYVKGYAINRGDKLELEIVKPKNFRAANSQISSTVMGQYLRINEVVGSWQLDQGARINFFDQVNRRITNNGVTTGQKWSTGAQSGNNIGSAIVNSIQYVSGTPGYDAAYDLYVTDIQMAGSNSISNVRSVYFDNSPHADVGGDILGANNTTSNTSLREVNKSALLYYVGTNYTKTVRDTDGSAKTIYYYSKTDGIASTISFPSSGIVTFSPSLPTNDILPYGTSALSSTDISQDIVVTMTGANFNVAMTGTCSGSGAVITGTGTNFTRLNLGDKVEFSGQSNTYYVIAIASDTSMTLSNTVPAVMSSNTIFKAYKTGDILNMTGKGVDAGTPRTITATPTALTLDLKETLGATRNFTLTYKVASTQSAEKLKTLRPNRYVRINCAPAISGTAGPYSLGFADVHRIRNIVLKNGSAPTSIADGTDVTSLFRLDNGQRDTQYDLARIFKSTSLTLSNTDFLLAHFDYFEPTTTGRAGFYTLDSYPIEDNDANTTNSTIRTENVPTYVSPTNQLSYDLRNYIDFRPVKSNTAVDSITVAGSSISPANTSNTYRFSTSSGMKFAIPSSEITYNYSSYLGRKDIVTIDKNGVFSVSTGIPSVNPVEPESLDSQMLLAVLDISPYPSLSPAYSNSLGRRDLSTSVRKVSNRRYTMRDIGVLDARIKNLEYYTSLTLLEKDAVNLKVLDATGLDRFKNGIFVDTFRDTSLSASGVDSDYRIVNDPVELSIRPIFSTESVGYDTITTSDVVVKNGVALLAYTENTEYINQTDVTDSRNIERSNYLFRGSLSLTPYQDVWVDTSQLADEIVEITSAGGLLEISSNQPGNDATARINKSALNTVWENWSTQITGYNLYRGEGASRQFAGTFSSEAAAAQAASAWTNQQTGVGATIETLFLNQRVGTNYFSNASTDQAVGANKLLSSEVIPYIRPQTVYVIGRSLKPYSKLNAFFDNVNVSEYCTPLTLQQYTALTTRASLAEIPALPAQGSSLIVNNDGFVYFSFRIPAGRFRTGDRNLVVIDGSQLAPNQLSVEQDASTSASGSFFANGTKQVMQKSIFSTKGFSLSSESTFQESRSRTEYLLPNTWTPPDPPEDRPTFIDSGDGNPGGGGGGGNSCVAYSVFVKVPRDEEGMFCTGFDVFIQRKSETRGLWFEIRAMNSASGITNVSIPGSIKRYTNSEVTVSPDGITNPMQVRFDSPVFLFNNTEYAFITHSDNPPGAKIDPDTSVWISRLGEVDINTGKNYNDRTNRGRFYSTSNDRKWDAIADVDMPITVYRANFTASSGSITLGNKGVEKLILKNVNSSFSNRIGDVFSSGDTLTLTGANGTITISNRLFGNVSTGNANGSVITINGSNFTTSNTRYRTGEKVDAYHSSNGVYTGVSATVSAVANSTAQLSYYDASTTNVYSEYVSSTGGFTVGGIVRSQGNSGFNNRAEVDFVGNFRYSAVSLEPKVLDFNKTALTYEMRTTSNATTTLDSFTTIIPSETTYFIDEKALLGRTNEILNLSGNRSNQIRVNMSSLSNFVSPVFDLDSSHTIYIDSIINNDVTGENGASGGRAINKYISQTITLADNQDAEDLRVYLTAYRPPNTDVRVYAKLDNVLDPETFAQKLWIPLEKENDGDSLYSSLTDRLNFREFSYKIPASFMSATDGVFQYTSNGTLFRGFKYFAIKIVLTSTNSALVPRVADLRALALQI